MIAAVDVCYSETGATAGGVLFTHWTSEHPARELREFIERVEPYDPGNFFKRELPCLLKVLEPVKDRVEAIIVDGYVWLGPEQRPGLGAHLYEALGDQTPVIGVAKSLYRRATNAEAILRGRSRRPLYVTAAGMDPVVAARNIQGMHGPHRIPSLLKRVDQLCRGTEKHSSG